MQLTRTRTNGLLLAGALLAAVVAFFVGRAVTGGEDPVAAPAVPKLATLETSGAPKVPQFAGATDAPGLRPAPKRRQETSGTTGATTGATTTGGTTGTATTGSTATGTTTSTGSTSTGSTSTGTTSGGTSTSGSTTGGSTTSRQPTGGGDQLVGSGGEE